MKCPTCESCEYEQYCGATEIMRKCERHNKNKPQTNEEWFCGLSTEEKVTALLDLRERIRQKMRGEIGSENKFYKGDYYREWLKEKHAKE